MVTSQPRAAVVYHPHKTNLADLRATVLAHETKAGWAPSLWYATTENDAGQQITRNALDKGASVVLAVGGDGTVRAVAETLRGSSVPVAVIPQGTGNVLARNLGIPLSSLDEAVRAAFFGKNLPIDLGVITITRPDESEDEHVFLVLAGMGLDARTITATRSSIKKRLGWLAYIDAGMRSMIKDAPLQIHYSVDGEPPKPLTVFTVMIGNCGLLPGGVLLIPDAEVDDGQLDVVALRPLGPFAWLRIWHKLGFENGVLRKSKTGRKMIDLVNDTRSVSYLRARQYALSVSHPEPIQLDGDEFGLALAAKGVVDPGGLLVRVLGTWAPAL